MHDYKLFKASKINIHSLIKVQADSGFQGLQAIHTNTELPQKRCKKAPLTKAEKRKNRELSSSRITVENVIRSIKIFRIVSEKYRNRRKRFGLRMNLIAGIYNFEIKN
jgi:hypothetical protein